MAKCSHIQYAFRIGDRAGSLLSNKIVERVTGHRCTRKEGMRNEHGYSVCCKRYRRGNNAKGDYTNRSRSMGLCFSIALSGREDKADHILRLLVYLPQCSEQTWV